MPSFAKCLVLLTLVAFVNALTSPHMLRSIHKRRSLAARVAAHTEAEPVAQVPEGSGAAPTLRRKRNNNGRCKKSSSSSSTTSSLTSETSRAAKAAKAATTSSADETFTKKADPTTTKKADPTTSSKEETKTSTTSKSSSTGTSSGSNLPSFLKGTQTGQGTFYGTGLGACGITNKDTDYIAAVSHLLFDAFPGYDGVNPNSNPLCGKKVTATYQGKSVTVKLTDRCTGCALTDLDFSPSAFQQLADESIGRISGMSWDWI